MSDWKGTEIGLIPPDWKIKTLDKYIQEGRGICYGVVQPGFYDENGVPIIRVNNLKEGRIIPDDVLKVSADIESKYSRSRLIGGEILISLVGNVGEIVIVDSQYEGWNIARAVGLVPVNDGIDKEWLKYWLQSSQVKHYISTHCNTTVQITLNLKDVSELPILEPPLEEQKLIASIPSVLDRKISNLRQQNETLEKIAQTLFKHWFVDFEFLNEEGKPYKSSGGEMVRSELGEIPVGWRVGKLGDEFEILMGQSPAGSSFNEDGEGLLFFQGRTDFGFRFPQARLFTTEPTRIANKYDVLVSVRAPVGDINVASEKCCIGRGLSAVSSKHQSYCLYKLKSYKKFFDVFESEGTVFGAMNRVHPSYAVSRYTQNLNSRTILLC